MVLMLLVNITNTGCHKDLYHLLDQRNSNSNRIGDTGDVLVASIINNKLDAGNEVHYDDVRRAILDVGSLNHQTSSHGSARSTVGASTVQLIYIE